MLRQVAERLHALLLRMLSMTAATSATNVNIATLIIAAAIAIVAFSLRNMRLTQRKFLQ